MNNDFHYAAFPPLLLGLDVGGSKTAAVMGTLEGEILERVEIPTPSREPFEAAFEQMRRAAEGLVGACLEKGLPRPEAISVAVGGPLDIERGVIFAPPHLPTWSNAPLKEKLEAAFGLPVFMEHDGNAGALAELTFGAGKGLDNLVYLTLGTGLGAGIILNGQVYRGTTCSAGEVGHIRLSESGPVEYGKAGSWEAFCSGAGMVKLARLRNPERWGPETTTRSLVEAALAGDPQACELVREAGAYLGKGMAILADILNPQMIVVGTLGVVLGDLLLEPAREAFEAEALPIVARACRIVPSSLGHSLSSLSALMAAIDAHRNHRLALQEAPHLAALRRAFQESLELRRKTLACLLPDIVRSAESILSTLKNGGKILVCGNGGSAAAAQHLSGELMGRYRKNRSPLPCTALTADSSILTCIGNDYEFEETFARQVQALARPGDLLIAFSTSGRSPNVLRALRQARRMGVATLALTGAAGLAEPLADRVLAVPSESTARIQEEHDLIVHAWCDLIDQEFAG